LGWVIQRETSVQLPSRLLGIAFVISLGFGSAACGPDDPKLAEDAGPGDDAPPDAPPADNLTKFVIDLITNHGTDPAPAAFDSFKDLPDPDGDMNNTAAYQGLFQ
jgi:hypothetical protein